MAGAASGGEGGLTSLSPTTQRVLGFVAGLLLPLIALVLLYKLARAVNLCGINRCFGPGYQAVGGMAGRLPPGTPSRYTDRDDDATTTSPGSQRTLSPAADMPLRRVSTRSEAGGPASSPRGSPLGPAPRTSPLAAPRSSPLGPTPRMSPQATPRMSPLGGV